MSEPTTVVISVRGDAEQLVPPDLGTVHGALRTVAGSKAAALRDVAAAQDALVGDLTQFGAVPFAADSPRQPVAWLSRSATTEIEHDYDDRTGRHGPTGNVIAQVAVTVYVRDFARRDDLDALLAQHELFNVHWVGWHVDADNPAWAEVRAAAIRAAILRGRDYAAALGGSLVRIDQVADAGLLGEGGERRAGGLMMGARAASAGFDEGQAPSLDPVPQTLSAVIDARFTASVPSLV
jgi:uncharacterized protein YggE